MSRLQVYDPFLASPFDDVFSGFLRPMKWEQQEMAPSQIKVDVEENDKAYTVKAEIPGVKKEDISVQIDGNRISIGAEVKKESDVTGNGGKVLRSERYYGSMTRSFQLGSDVDEAKADAKYADGVLELSLPKKASAATKRLAIH